MFNLKAISKAFLFMIACVAMGSSASAQDQTRFVLKLDNDLISSFRSYRSLRSNVPQEYMGKISFVELQFAETKDAEPVEMDLGMTINGETANITLTEETIAMVKGQPVRVAVSADAKMFSQIVLIYDTPAAIKTEMNAGGQTTGGQTTGGQTTDMYFIRLSDDNIMSGSMDGFEQFEIKTGFGQFTIPMDQVAGIKFHSDNQDSAVVVLNNGDSITGIPTIPLVKLTTDWGQADIESKSMDSLTTNSVAKFIQETTDFGTRWVLKTGSSLAPASLGFGN